MLEKQDSGVCLSVPEPDSPTEGAGVARPVAFFVNVGGPATGADAVNAGVRKTPSTSSAGDPTTPRHVSVRRTRSGQSYTRSTSSPRTVSGAPGRPQGDASASTQKTNGQTFHGVLQKFTKVSSYT